MKQSVVLSAADRLAAIAASELLDMGAIPALDRIVRVAAELLAAPVAQVNVVTGDHHIPISQIGGEPSSHAVLLEHSFHNHVITSGKPLVVRDVREHSLPGESPAVTRNGVAVYLSAPIRLPRAQGVIATLCVVDFHPRDWTDADLQRLTDLSSWAESEIELRAENRELRRQSEAALKASETRLRLALDSAQLGVWDLDLGSGRMECTPQCRTKGQFLAVMSHELRTPLNAIMGYADLLLGETKGPITSGQENQIERVKQGGRQVLELIEEILSYARLEAGKEEVRLGTADAARLVRMRQKWFVRLRTGRGSCCGWMFRASRSRS